MVNSTADSWNSLSIQIKYHKTKNSARFLLTQLSSFQSMYNFFESQVMMLWVKTHFFECKLLFLSMKKTVFSSFSVRVMWSERWVHWIFAEIFPLEYWNLINEAWNICVRTIWQFDSNLISCQIILDRLHYLKWRWQVLNSKKNIHSTFF